VWRREALLEAMDASEAELRTYKMAGDWHLYLQALSTPGAQVGYCAEPLNTHRRHGASVTHALDANKHVAEIAACQEFARSAFALSEGVQKTQVGYLREVSVQLGATSKKLESSQSEIKVAAKAGGPRTSKVFKRKS
jgi:hypothetical protein